MGCDFDLRLAIHLRDSTHAGQTPGNLACNVSHKSQPLRGKNESPRMIAAIPERRAVTEEISGVIERVTFHNEDSGFCILRVKARLGAFSGLIRISRRL